MRIQAYYLVWTKCLTVTIKLRFQIYPTLCGRGLKYSTSNGFGFLATTFRWIIFNIDSVSGPFVLI